MDALLGRDTDFQIAKKYNISTNTIRKRRKLLGIRSNQLVWTANMDRQIGTMPDSILSIKLGLTYNQVNHRRKQLGKPTYRLKKEQDILAQNITPHLKKGRKPNPPIEWSNEMLTNLPIMRAKDFMRAYGVLAPAYQAKKNEMNLPKLSVEGEKNTAAYKGYKWTEEALALLGTMTDQRVADNIGVDHQVVFQKRRRLGIDPVNKKFKWNDDRVALLGTMPDRDLAKKFGLILGRVRNKRTSMGIPKYREFNLKKSLSLSTAQFEPDDFSRLEQARQHYIQRAHKHGLPITTLSNNDVLTGVLRYFCEKIDNGEIES
jgi:hypothetical protein